MIRINQTQILIKVPNRSERDPLFRPYMSGKEIWSTDSVEELTAKMVELLATYPSESLITSAITPWNLDVTVNDTCNCVDCDCTEDDGDGIP